jgi:predicted DNA-binding ribbon-helix-helix protein
MKGWGECQYTTLILSLSKDGRRVATSAGMTVNLKKRSFSLSGHRTSVALEPEFWDVLERVAARENLNLSAFIARIDAGRGARALASALRLRALAAGREPS